MTSAAAWASAASLHGLDQVAGQGRVDDAVGLGDPDGAGAGCGAPRPAAAGGPRQRATTAATRTSGDDGQSERRAARRARGAPRGAPARAASAPLRSGARRPHRPRWSRPPGWAWLVAQHAPHGRLHLADQDSEPRRSARIRTSSPFSMTCSKPLAARKSREKNSQCSRHRGVPPSSAGDSVDLRRSRVP